MNKLISLIVLAALAAPAAAAGMTKGYIAANDPAAGALARPLEWVALSGGKFTMGTDSGENGFENAKPVHEVVLKNFELSKTAVTVEQYRECVIKGGCTEPGTGEDCNWGEEGREFHPVNCVDWNQAKMYAKFKGGRLPSESEWEYAATGGGRNQKYPWGNEAPTCDRAVMLGKGGYGCGSDGTMPVCSKPAGNTAQGLCDMTGNVWQWVQDSYSWSYNGAPADGGTVEFGGGYSRVVRSGSWTDYEAGSLRSDLRRYYVPGYLNRSLGFRLARSK
jgi:sulfatase modifying factor 1